MVNQVSKTLVDMGCYEISLGDTIGIGTPGKSAFQTNSALTIPSLYDQSYATHFWTLLTYRKRFSPRISTTRTIERFQIFLSLLAKVLQCLTHQSLALEGAPMPRVPQEMWPLKTFCTCVSSLELSMASISRRSGPSATSYQTSLEDKICPVSRQKIWQACQRERLRYRHFCSDDLLIV